MGEERKRTEDKTQREREAILAQQTEYQKISKKNIKTMVGIKTSIDVI